LSSHPPTDVTRQAAHWVVQLRCADRSANAERDFADWLRASPLHVAEYLRAVEVWEGLCDRVPSSSARRNAVPHCHCHCR